MKDRSLPHWSATMQLPVHQYCIFTAGATILTTLSWLHPPSCTGISSMHLSYANTDVLFDQNNRPDIFKTYPNRMPRSMQHFRSSTQHIRALHLQSLPTLPAV